MPRRKTTKAMGLQPQRQTQTAREGPKKWSLKMKRSMISVIGLVIVVGVASAALAAPTIYTLSPLSGYTGINVSAINDSGAAVGYCTNSSGGAKSFIWTVSGGMVSLGGTGALYARDNNNAGQIVGDSSTGESIYWANTTTASVITLAGYNGGIANEINESGQVVGRAGYNMTLAGGTNATSNRKGYVWDSIGNTIVFSPNANGIVVQEFLDINDNGVAVGGQRARYDATTSTMTLLGSGTWGTGRDINNAGTAVGTDGVNYAFQQTSGGVITPLGALTGYSSSQTTPMGINELGQVVGDCGYGGAAFIWENGTMTALNTVLGNSSWNLKNANDINESGWIVGQGTLNGAAVGYVMTPEPATMSLLALGGLGAIIRRRRRAAK
jgi:hypothetical protein